MIAPSRAAAQLMTDLGIGVYPHDDFDPDEWIVTVGFLPDSEEDQVDNRLAFTDAPGSKQGREQRGGKTILHQFINLALRGSIYEEVYEKAMDIVAAFDAVSKTVVAHDGNDYTIHAIHVVAPPMFTGRDAETNRSNFSLNAMVKLEES